MSHHLAYLNAMGITLWQRRDLNFETPIESQAEASVEVTAQSTAANSRSQPSVKMASSNPEVQMSAQAVQQTSTKVQPTSPVIEVSGNAEPTPSHRVDKAQSANKSVISEPQNGAKTVKEPKPATATEASANGYLVLPKGVAWKSGGLTVICRHEPGQPAQSYVRNGAPSKTVSNVLLAFESLLPEGSPSILKNANFAQLSSTALSEFAVEAARALKQSQPKAILVMGAAAANQLLQLSYDMGQWQARSWQTPEGVPMVVTYHPYEIFTSPILKKQVFKDLLVLRQWFIDDGA